MEKQGLIHACIEWIEKNIGCEVYIIHHDEKTNGFAEFRNDGHIIYVIGDLETMPLDTFIDILSHESGHVLYNEEQMKNGIPYEDIVHRTQQKLAVFDQLLKEQVISDREYDRLYDAIEEEHYSNQKKEQILQELKKKLIDPLEKGRDLPCADDLP